MGSARCSCKDLQQVSARIIEKRGSYKSYAFGAAQNDLLHTFFDLAQEFDSPEDFYRICVAAPKLFLGFDSRLHLLDERRENLVLVSDSRKGLLRKPKPSPIEVFLSNHCYETENSLLVPICRKPATLQTAEKLTLDMEVMGMLEVFPLARLSEADRFFMRKYSNRIGFNLHNRLIAQENIRHLKFINTLVMDIEHNVITPNMYFKHLFNRLKKRIKEVGDLEELLKELKKPGVDLEQSCQLVGDKVTNLYQRLQANYRQLLEHHANYSLFLESLFRRDHFAKGRFVLRSRNCSVDTEIVTPQLDHFMSRFRARGIEVERPGDMHGEELLLQVDVGLLSQVYANLFSNAVKYTESIIDHAGLPRKAIAYGREYIHDYFGPGKSGIKFNVFTTGRHLSGSEAKIIFTDGIRGESSKMLPGTGHGLAFIKQVIEIHGGVVGYEPTAEGNNFFFVLPVGCDSSSAG
ncbi:MAG: sensor histidine kinase [Desulfobulbaceae bacterium]|nr:sensor histidine kinase [Desulfobulbaceae bacterium]HIJ78214.1 sensor histidine kinase [Deltaproteobacteria bacterium]